MKRSSWLAAGLCLFLAGSGRLAAQIPGLPASQPAPATAAPDALGRDTPRGTVTGFNMAVHREDFALAGSYLERAGQSAAQTETLARDLNGLLDRYFTQPVSRLSGSPAGALNDGLPPDRERLLLTMGDRSVPIFLERVSEPDTGPIWLFSSDSLAQVRTLSRSPQATYIERLMPADLIARSYWGISVAQWILWAASIVIPFLLLWALALLFSSFTGRLIPDPSRRVLFQSWWRGVRWLIVIGLTLAAHLALIPFLGFGLTYRYAYSRTVVAVGVVIFALLSWRLLSVTFAHARLLALRHGRSDTRSLILLGERVVKVLVVLIAVFATLALAGVDLTTALAGVGIAGVAVALGAQKSVENLLGAIFLLTDKVLAVGDYCRLSDREGWIEDITLRSVRLRTLQQTLLSVPAGALSQGSIENFGSRGKILVQSMLRLKYGTTTGQIQTVLAHIRRILLEEPDIEKESARVRLTGFGTEAIELELFAYVVTGDVLRFLEVRENILLRAAAAVEAAGTAFAAPTQFIYVREDAAAEMSRT
jgi:MscS family membrane protein